MADLGARILPPKVFIYMNHFIKEPKNREPVITVQIEGRDRVVYGNNVELIDEAGRVVARVIFEPEGLKTAAFHHVKAWVETRLKVRVQ